MARLFRSILETCLTKTISNLYKLGQTDNATCRLCKGADETMYVHVHNYVHAISLKRLLHLGKANLTPEEVVSVAPRQVLNFFASLELP